MLDRMLATFAPLMLSVLRIATALTFLSHGTAKLLGFPDLGRAGPAMLSLSGVAGLLELAGGALLVIGLFTRPVAFVLSGLMAFAYFIGHFPAGSRRSATGARPPTCSASSSSTSPSPAAAQSAWMRCAAGARTRRRTGDRAGMRPPARHRRARPSLRTGRVAMPPVQRGLPRASGMQPRKRLDIAARAP